MTSLPLSLSPMTPHPHRCCWCYPLQDTMFQCEHPLTGSRPSGTEYDCMPRCHILSCMPWCVCRSLQHVPFLLRTPDLPAFSTPATWCRLPRFQCPHKNYSKTWSVTKLCLPQPAHTVVWVDTLKTWPSPTYSQLTNREQTGSSYHIIFVWDKVVIYIFILLIGPPNLLSFTAVFSR